MSDVVGDKAAIRAAEAAKLAAEARRNEAEARKFEAEARAAESNAAKAEFENNVAIVKAQEAEQARLLGDDHQRILRFTGVVGESTVAPALERLTRWSRIDPGCDITIVINSPGGDVISGMALFDYIRELEGAGHKVTTVGQGMVASMGGVLLQASTSERTMSRGSSLLIHETSFGAAGSFGKIEDQVSWVSKVQDRILDIFAERSTLSRVTIKKKWTRKDWWMLADEALKYGFIDRIV